VYNFKVSRISLRENLSKIGEPRPCKRLIHIPSDFHSKPKPTSLKAMIQSMNPPKMESWVVKCEDHQAVAWWTFECQGITTDGKYFYAVNNNWHKYGMGIFKFHLGYGDAVRYRRWPFDTKNHIGPPSYFERKIYVPVETDDAPRVWILNTDLDTLALATLRGTEISKQGNKMPWCAINPWNHFLYSSRFGERKRDPPVTEVHCYDPANSFEFKESLRLQGSPLFKVQGGCFSTNGHLYLTSDASKAIHGYNVLNGSYLGQFSVPSDWSGFEEMEGIAIGNLYCKDSGDLVPVHVLVLDNDLPRVDSDIWLKHIAVPAYEFL
jgi:hypothetical protein